jgi:hypothetical protein
MTAQAAPDLDYAPLTIKQMVQLRALLVAGWSLADAAARLGVLARDCDLALWREIGR